MRIRNSQRDAEIRMLPPGLAGRAVGVLTRAFSEDPILTFYLRHPSRRAVAYRTFFGEIVQSALPLGHVYGAIDGDRVLGVAVWRPPDLPKPSIANRARSAMGEAFVRALFPRTAGELFRGFANLQELHPRVPHWYLMFVGIDVGLQGRGIGSRVLAPVLELADATNTICYLETPFPQTHEFYRRLGFEIVAESHPFRGAPPLWTMTRESRGPALVGEAGPPGRR
jgi:ribosomal protein S18 acetylase RimI-like enzyme